MKLLLKFNLIFVLVFGLGIAAAGALFYRFLRDGAKDEVLQQAHLMMQTALANRTYTTSQIKPLLVHHPDTAHRFLPQTVPAYAATESFAYLQKIYGDYSYKEATLNPTNLRDRAVDWEADVIRTFRDHPEQKALTGERETPTGGSLFLAQPLRADASCMECHSVPRRAPAQMVSQYGSANGFGWKEGEVIGAQIVSVPTALANQNAERAFRTVLVSMVVVALLTMLMLDAGIMLIVIRPVTRLSEMADRVSRGEVELSELPARGDDEIAGLTRSLNRMCLSMAKAIRMLEGG